jgi:hypothetical protein
MAALWSKKIAKYGGKWDFLGQTAILLSACSNFDSEAKLQKFYF